jgi:hypothetical protein
MIEPTVTQNSALYFAQHTNSKQSLALFRRFRLRARNQRVARKQPTFGELFFWPRLYGKD